MLAQIFELRHGHADIHSAGAVATNSERQSQHANEKKSRRLYKCSRSITQIGDEIFHSASSTNVADVFMPNRKFYKFIIITMILTSTHDSAIRWEEVLGLLDYF